MRSNFKTIPMHANTNPTGKVISISQIYAPVPLPSSHIETPWINPVTKAINNGEKATSSPTRTKGKRFMNSA
jgi:hypothetical protein